MALKILKPETEKEFELGTTVEFEGTADNSITQVEIWADDRWLLGKVSVNEKKWSFSYIFNGTGTRTISAKGFDGNNNLIDTDNLWVFIELPSAFDLDQQLSSSFTLREMVFSQTAQMRGLDNTPTLDEIARLKTLCQRVLQPARDALGSLKITSSFRSEAVNNAVGGVRNSAHRLGYAADIIPTNGDTRALALWVANNKLAEIDQIILEFGTREKPSWIHISVDPQKRRKILRATRRNGSTVYTSIAISDI